VHSRIALALVLVAGVASTASADDVKVHHGTVCQATYPSDLTWNIIGLFNRSDQFMSVKCPLTRDRIGYGATLKDVAIEAYNASGSLYCAVWTLIEDPSRTTVQGAYTYGYQSKSTTTTGNVQLGGFQPPTSPGNEGAYVVECHLEPGDGIYQIHVREDTANTSD